MDRINHVKIATPDPESVRRFLCEVVNVPEGWSIGPPNTFSPRKVVSPARDEHGDFTRAGVLAFRGGPPDPVGFLVGDAQSRAVQIVQADTPRIWGVAIGSRDVEGAHRRCIDTEFACTEIHELPWGDGESITFFYAEVGGVVFEILRVNSREARGVATDTVVLDDEIAAALAQGPSVPELSIDALQSLDATRRARDEAFACLPRSDAVERVDHVVSDDPRVVVRVHRPKGVDGPLPCVYSMHGGGYVAGTYEMDDLKFDDLCPRVPCVGVAVEYRLAPETPYPGPLDDCYSGLHWTFERAEELGISSECIGVTGSSAGGGLAAAH